MYERLRFLGFARNDILGDDGGLVGFSFWRNDDVEVPDRSRG